MKININKDLCLGCGTCVALAPEIFEMTEENKSRVKEGVDLEKNKNAILQAKNSCPCGAIKLEE